MPLIGRLVTRGLLLGSFALLGTLRTWATFFRHVRSLANVVTDILAKAGVNYELHALWFPRISIYLLIVYHSCPLNENYSYLSKNGKKLLHTYLVQQNCHRFKKGGRRKKKECSALSFHHAQWHGNT